MHYLALREQCAQKESEAVNMRSEMAGSVEISIGQINLDTKAAHLPVDI